MIATVEGINQVIRNNDVDTNLISDRYHTFGELYEHRIILYIALCKVLQYNGNNYPLVWKTKVHSDGSVWDGWFLLGIGIEKEEQITYHLPDIYWSQCDFKELEKAPEFDGHSSQDVLDRLKSL